MSAHTPGPWRYELDGHETNDMRHAILSEANDLWVAACYRSGTTAKRERSEEAEKEAEANARLMAAAPDLLAALKVMLRDVEAVSADGQVGIELEPSIYQASAAIAKATSGTA